MGIGDWGMGIAIPNPQSPIPNNKLLFIYNKNYINYTIIHIFLFLKIRVKDIIK